MKFIVLSGTKGMILAWQLSDGNSSSAGAKLRLMGRASITRIEEMTSIFNPESLEC